MSTVPFPVFCDNGRSERFGLSQDRYIVVVVFWQRLPFVSKYPLLHDSLIDCAATKTWNWRDCFENVSMLFPQNSQGLVWRRLTRSFSSQVERQVPCLFRHCQQGCSSASCVQGRTATTLSQCALDDVTVGWPFAANCSQLNYRLAFCSVIDHHGSNQIFLWCWLMWTQGKPSLPQPGSSTDNLWLGLYLSFASSQGSCKAVNLAFVFLCFRGTNVCFCESNLRIWCPEKSQHWKHHAKLSNGFDHFLDFRMREPAIVAILHFCLLLKTAECKFSRQFCRRFEFS